MSMLRGVLAVLTLASCISGSAATAQTPESTRRVLVLHPYTPGLPSSVIVGDTAGKRLTEILQRKVEIYPEFLDMARFPGDAHLRRTASYLAEKYARTPLDIVMPLGSDSLRFIISHRGAIAPDAPVLFCCVAPTTLAGIDLPQGVSGILSGLDLSRTMQLAARLQPTARDVVVVAGESDLDRRLEQTARRQLASYTSRHRIRYLVGLPYEHLLDELKRLPSDTIVLLTSVFRDGAGRTFVPRDVAQEIARVSSAPVYAPYDTYLGRGIVGGYMDTFEASGIALAELAAETLAQGKSTVPPPRPNPASSYRVDWTQLKRWGLSEANLIPGTVVLFRNPSFWEQHRTLILGTAGAFALQTALVFFLLLQVHRRRQAEASLKDSEERMAFAAASVNVGLWQYDTASGRVWATDHCRAMFDIDAAATLGRDSFLAAVHLDDRQAARSWMRSITQSPSPATGEFRVVLEDGDVRWYIARGRTRLDDKGQPAVVSGVFADITARKAAESEADAQRRILAHTARVSALGGLSGTIAHEINQPLTAILSNAQAARRMLAKEPPDLVEVGEALDDIIHEDNRAGDVIRRLRGMLRKGDGRTEPTALNELVRSTLRLLQSELVNRHISVVLELGDRLPAVPGDPVQLQQVLLNLVMNAMDAVTSPQALQRAITVSTRAPEPGRVEAVVADRGPGLSADQEARLFEPFYTTKEHGLGLGLAICASIAGAHGGTLDVANGPDGGACARLVLPALQPAAVSP